MHYVDGFLLVVPKKKLAAYRKMATLGAKMWKKYGALDYKECVGDDLNSSAMGGFTFSFPKAVKLKPGEVVIFSYIVFKSRAHRDRVNAKVMADPSMDPAQYEGKAMPFDMKRMAYGGFTVIVE
jgi:alkaline phosphatase